MNKIISSDDLCWNYYLEQMPFYKRDIYYTREYYRMYEKNGDGIARLFIYQEGEKLALYPFLVNEIAGYDLKESYYDIETAYGYGGPLVNKENDIKFIRNFEENFLQYCKKSNIIAEFIRFNPYLKNEKIFMKNIIVMHNRTTVFLDLRKSIDEIWIQDISSKNRNMIRKAEKNNLKIEKENNVVEFQKLYESTMDKVVATPYYYFNEDYYNTIGKNDNYNILNVRKDDKVIAAAIFMNYGIYMHYHLAGSNQAYLGCAPNNLLLWEAIKYAKQLNCQLFHLGGGLSDSREDSLFKFKSSFSKDYLEFYIGKRVHNNEVYNYLIEIWEKRNGIKANILLQYRL